MPAGDETLVWGALHGDRPAFAELYDRHARLIRAVCYDATGDLHSAADLTQEVFLRAYEGLARLRSPQRFVPWLVGIARQACREWRRGRRRDRAGFERWTACEATKAAAAAEDRQDERIERLRKAIALLPENERLALHAFYLQEQDVEQARTVLGLSRSGFYRVLAAARRRLERVLRKQEASP